jgi:NAD(P)-dependent dehydrogenase (short-subunit alcohol dehydrogenase family)
MNKVVLISGATRGIGYLTAQLLHNKGYTVYGTGRNPKPEDAPFRLLPLDVRDDTSVHAAVAQMIAEAGRLDVLVNNAGYDLYGAVEDTSWEEFTAQLDTNFIGVVRLIQAVLPHMRRHGSGKIVNISSIGGLLALPFNSAYSASKFALEGYTESLRYELLPFHIYTSLIEPGQARTDTLDTSIRSVGNGGAVYGVNPAHIAERARQAGSIASLSAEQIARTIVAVIESPRPRLRYRVGGQVRSLSLLKQLLPERLFESAIMRLFVTPLLHRNR